MQPIVNDFFCGCGGMGVGFLNAGYKIAGAWDFDKYAVQSYDHNVGHHVKQADIKEMTWQDVPFAHVWAFGFPCQDLSVAGKQAGLLLKCQDCDSDFAIDPSNFTGQTTCPSCGSKNYKAASRSGCFYEIMRLIDETREHAPSSLPAVLVAENVKRLNSVYSSACG
jgi:DNA (cytosine-5)-methyltransferase 1